MNHSTPTTILVVDDNPTNLKLAVAVLESEDYRVEQALDAEQALAAIARSVPDLILMDIALPGMDGLELTRKLRADEATRHIRIVAMTAFAMKGDEQPAIEAGCRGYISKPIDTRRLPLQVAEYLQMAPNRSLNVLIVEDIEPNRKQAEETLRQNQDKLTLAMRAARMGSWSFDLTTGRFEADEAGMALHGFAPGETITRLDEGNRHLHPHDLPEIQRRFAHAVQTRGTYENEYRVVLPDGGIRWIHSLGRVPEGSSYLIGMVQDITARKQAEAALRERERLLSESQRIGHIGSWAWDLADSIQWTQWTDETYRIFGVEPATFTPMFDSFVSLVHPDDRAAVQESNRASRAG
jgi:PAS domain S-box-containing protein